MRIKTLSIFLFITLFSTVLSAQNIEKARKEILAEGLRMYYMERASWVSTDYLVANVDPQSIPDFTGYITYDTEEKIVSTYWVNNGGKPQIFATISFKAGEEVDFAKATIEMKRRNPSKQERLLYKIRDEVNKEAQKNKDFVRYEGVNINLVYLQQKKHIDVFLLPGLSVSGVIPIGSDYKLTFNKKGKLLSAEKIHQGFIPIDLENREEGNEDAEVAHSMHSHTTTGKFITSTDICTLLLYAPKGTGHQHIVVSETHVSMFNIDKRQLLILTRKAFEKMMNIKEGEGGED